MPVDKRLAAVGALLAGGAAIVLAVVEVVSAFPRGLWVLGAVALALWLALHALTHRGARRAIALGLAVALLIGGFAAVVGEDPLITAAVVALAIVSSALARAAFRGRVELPAAPRPQNPVLFYNPRSGGGKATRFDLPTEARKRGIKPVELTPGTDLETLVREEVAAGADALAMAGGDGSQAIVAMVAAERGLPYACIPAGTRNHFALDLGVDRDDVVGALDALVDGGERVVDLAEVDGRVFVNNVSLGLYATAVQRDGYRGAKIRTLLDTVPDVAGAEAVRKPVQWREPGGDVRGTGVVMLVSNNPYRLGSAAGSGTRPRLDAASLGVVVLGGDGNGGGAARRGWQESTAAEIVVDAEDGEPIAAGIDGEAVMLPPHFSFRVRPAALRVRVARDHPGASPSALRPAGTVAGAKALLAIAAGRV